MDSVHVNNTKKRRRQINVIFGRLTPKWWTKQTPSTFSKVERAKRRKKNRTARASRKANR